MGRNKRRARIEPKGSVAPDRLYASRRVPAWGAVGAMVVLVIVTIFFMRAPPISPASPSTTVSAETPVSAETMLPEMRVKTVEVVREFSHERDAYTQGLVWWNG